MALWLPGNTGCQVQTNGNAGTTAIATTVTGSATPHTKGSWTTLIASTNFDVAEILLQSAAAIGISASDTSTLFDIGIGAASSETVLVENVNIGHSAAAMQWRFPIRVASGARIACRLQSAVASKTAAVGMTLVGGGGWDRQIIGRRATTYGANTADSSGVLLDDPTANNTEGAWTEITASLTSPMRYLLPFLSGKAGDTAWTAANHLVDIATGASGSEVLLFSNLLCATTSTEIVTYPPVMLPVSLPAGTRLSMRIQQSGGTGTPIEATIIGID